MIDEIGFAPLDDTGTQLLFRLVAAAYERRSLAIASHWSFDKAHMFGRTCARCCRKRHGFAGFEGAGGRRASSTWSVR